MKRSDDQRRLADLPAVKAWLEANPEPIRRSGGDHDHIVYDRAFEALSAAFAAFVAGSKREPLVDTNAGGAGGFPLELLSDHAEFEGAAEFFQAVADAIRTLEPSRAPRGWQNPYRKGAPTTFEETRRYALLSYMKFGEDPFRSCPPLEKSACLTWRELEQLCDELEWNRAVVRSFKASKFSDRLDPDRFAPWRLSREDDEIGLRMDSEMLVEEIVARTIWAVRADHRTMSEYYAPRVDDGK